ncbi:MAG: hypothetical protein R2827_08730 [Bdellovibrionales bacterium]
MMWGRDLKPDHRMHCQGADDPGGKDNAPCVTEELVQYIYLHFRKGLECINSDGGYPVDPKEFYKIVNHESRFQYNVVHNGGIGITQIVTPAARDMGLVNGYPGIARQAWDQVKDNPTCQFFTDVVSDDGPELKANGVVEECQFLDIKEGLRRAMINGLAIYKSYQQRVLEMVGPQFFGPGTKREDRERMITIATRVAYNKGYTAWRTEHIRLMNQGAPKSPEEYERRIEKRLYPGESQGYSTLVDQHHKDLNKEKVYGEKYRAWREKVIAASTKLNPADTGFYHRPAGGGSRVYGDKLKGWFADVVDGRTPEEYQRNLTFGISKREWDRLMREYHELKSLEVIYDENDPEQLPPEYRPC